MPKEKYDPPDPRRIYTIMSAEEVANGKKSHWAELEISGESICLRILVQQSFWMELHHLLSGRGSCSENSFCVVGGALINLPDHLPALLTHLQPS